MYLALLIRLMQIIQHQPVKYHRIPVSPLNERRLCEYPPPQMHGVLN